MTNKTDRIIEAVTIVIFILIVASLIILAVLQTNIY